ncbi:MAG: hypothetical protein ACTHJ4_06690 [Candidatus Nucleicultricaceae bacterium]
MKKVMSALMMLLLSSHCSAMRLYRAPLDPEVTRITKKTTKALSSSYALRILKEKEKANDMDGSSLKTYKKLLRMQKKTKLQERLERIQKAQQKRSKAKLAMDVDYDIITQDLDVMDWVLTGAQNQTIQNQDIEMDTIPEQKDQTQGFNFFAFSLEHEFDVIQLHKIGCDLTRMINELAERANYLNYAWFNQPNEQMHGLFAATMMRNGMQQEFNQVLETLQEFLNYRSGIEGKITWILSDPRGAHQLPAFRFYLEMLEASINPQPIIVMPTVHYVIDPVQNNDSEEEEETWALPQFRQETPTYPTSLSSQLAHESSDSTPLIVNHHVGTTYAYPDQIADLSTQFQGITPVYQYAYTEEDPSVDTENVMSADRQHAAQGSVPAVMRHTASLMRSDVVNHENELFREVVAYLNTMLSQKHKFKRENSTMDEVSNAIYALIGPKKGRDFPNFESVGEATMSGHTSVTMKSLLTRIWLTIKTYKNEKDRENLKHSLILALGQCIEKDGHRVCSVGKTQRLLSVLQGYLEGVDIDAYREKTEAKATTGKTETPDQEEPKPDFQAFFKNFMITKNSEMAAIAAKPESEHKVLLAQIVQKAVDEVVDVYGEDADKIQSVKAEMKSFIELTFDVEIDYDAIKALPKDQRPTTNVSKGLVGNAKVTLKKMVDKVRHFCLENASTMTQKTAGTVSIVVQFLRSWASSLFV